MRLRGNRHKVYKVLCVNMADSTAKLYRDSNSNPKAEYAASFTETRRRVSTEKPKSIENQKLQMVTIVLAFTLARAIPEVVDSKSFCWEEQSLAEPREQSSHIGREETQKRTEYYFVGGRRLFWLKSPHLRPKRKFRKARKWLAVDQTFYKMATMMELRYCTSVVTASPERLHSSYFCVSIQRKWTTEANY